MNSSAPVLMQLLGKQMNYLSNRQGVLSQNIANIDTPNYKSRDLKKIDFGGLVEAESARLEMRATSAKHLGGTLAGGNSFAEETIRKPFEETPVGNNVVLEEQMAKISDTGAMFQLSSSLFSKYGQLLRIATSNRT